MQTLTRKSLTLYEMAEEYRNTLEMLLQMEDMPEAIIRDTLEGLLGEPEKKAINIAAWIKELELEAEAISQVEQSVSRKRKRLEKQAEWYRNYLKCNLEKMGIKEIKTSAWFTIRIQNSTPRLNFSNSELIPDEYIITTYIADKGAIKKSLEEGKEVPGAELVQGTSLVIR